METPGYKRYTSKSNPELGARIPEEYAKKAGRLVAIALKPKEMTELFKRVNKYAFLADMYIPDKTIDLMKNSNSLKLQDEVYLLACLCLSQDDLSKNGVIYGEFPINDGHKRLENIRNNQTIRNMLESL